MYLDVGLGGNPRCFNLEERDNCDLIGGERRMCVESFSLVIVISTIGFVETIGNVLPDFNGAKLRTYREITN